MPSTCPDCGEAVPLFTRHGSSPDDAHCAPCHEAHAFHGVSYDCDICGGCSVPLGLHGSHLVFRCECCGDTQTDRLVPATP